MSPPVQGLPLYTIQKRVAPILAALAELPAVRRTALSGEARRGVPIVRSLCIVAQFDDVDAVSRALSLVPGVRTCGHSDGTRLVVTHDELPPIIIERCSAKDWGSTLLHTTGPDDFVSSMPDAAAPDESTLFSRAACVELPPEIRHRFAELELDATDSPRLVEATDLRGDLHMHTTASDGRGTLEETVEAARNLGLAYIAITEHSKSLRVARGLHERRLLEQGRDIIGLQERLDDIVVARGVEVDILADGSLDLDLEVLKGLDWVVASVHSDLGQTEEAMTARVVRAIESGVVDCIGHPRSRRLGHREESAIDVGRVIEAAARCGVALEVNGNPFRMDLDDDACRQAVEGGATLVINTDAHAPAHLSRREYGVLAARRGLVGPQNVLNTRPWDAIVQQRRDRFTRQAWTFPTPVPPPARATPPPHPPLDRPTVAHWPDDVPALNLNASPLPDNTRLRLNRWIHEGNDPELTEALKQLGGDPLLRATALLRE